MEYNLICGECGNGFSFHRKKKYCSDIDCWHNRQMQSRKKYYTENREKLREYYKNHKDRILAQGKEWRKNNPDHNEKQRVYYKQWYALKGRRRTEEAYNKAVEWMKSNPEKCKARHQLQYQVTLGKIIKPLNCQICNATGRLSGHHHDYNKPYDIIWICSSCHKRIHNWRKDNVR